jgi:hypothetical protein
MNTEESRRKNDIISRWLDDTPHPFTGFTARARDIRARAERGESVSGEDALFLLATLERVLGRRIPSR